MQAATATEGGTPLLDLTQRVAAAIRARYSTANSMRTRGLWLAVFAGGLRGERTRGETATVAAPAKEAD